MLKPVRHSTRLKRINSNKGTIKDGNRNVKQKSTVVGFVCVRGGAENRWIQSLFEAEKIICVT